MIGKIREKQRWFYDSKHCVNMGCLSELIGQVEELSYREEMIFHKNDKILHCMAYKKISGCLLNDICNNWCLFYWLYTDNNCCLVSVFY